MKKRCFILQIDEETENSIDLLLSIFGKSKAEIVRVLINAAADEVRKSNHEDTLPPVLRRAILMALPKLMGEIQN